MWVTFAISILAALVFLYIPGTLIVRAFKPHGLTSYIAGPLVSLFIYEVLCVAFQKFGITCTWVSVGVPAIALGSIVFLISLIIKKGRGKSAKAKHSATAVSKESPFSFRHIFSPKHIWHALYICVGLLVGAVLFLFIITNPNYPEQMCDNWTHITIITTFLNTGSWSPIMLGDYPAYCTAVPLTTNVASYYPALFHAFVALVASATGSTVPLAENAVFFVLIFIVFPSGVFNLLFALCKKITPGMVAGAIIFISLSAFPWRMYWWTCQAPLLMAYAFIPAFTFLFMQALNSLKEKHLASYHVLNWFTICVCIFALVAMHPSSSFVAAIFVAPLIVQMILTMPSWSARRISRTTSIGAAIAFLAVFVLIWLLFYSAPFMQSIVQFDSWESLTDLKTGVAWTLSLTFEKGFSQVPFALLALIGLVYALRKKDLRWVIFPALISIVLYIVCISYETEGLLRQLLCGFWYSDARRIAGMYVISLIPLLAFGVDQVYEILVALFSKGASADSAVKASSPSRKTSASRKVAFVLALAVFAVFYGLNTVPPKMLPWGEDRPSAMTYEIGRLRVRYDPATPAAECIYSLEEQAFAKQVKTIVGDELVLNSPFDGSILACQLDGINCFWRSHYAPNGANESETSKILRAGLSHAATDTQVQTALREINAKYVMVFVQGGRASGEFLPDGEYDDDTWAEIDKNITDATPGFELVLSDGVRKLYRITAV